jgi:hypothetical protein
MSSAFSFDFSATDPEHPWPPAPAIESSGWTTVSRFEIIVSQQTSAESSRYQAWVHHLPSNLTEVFAGGVSDRLLIWMQQRLVAGQNYYEDPTERQGQPLLEIQHIVFLQIGNPDSPITISDSPDRIPPALKCDSPFSLEIAWNVTPWSKQQLAQSPEELNTCQIQAYIKPLSPIQSSDHWRTSASLPVVPAEDNYCTRLESITLGAGIYSLQILCLMSTLRSSPVLVEIPVVQVN